MPESKEDKPNPYMSQLSFFASPEMSVRSTDEGFGLAIDDEVNRLLAQQAPVAIGISGGKDSSACAWAVVAYLNRIGHRGPRVLVHADLGQIEWEDSARICQRVAHQLGIPLITVQRRQGGMIERWQQRWQSNVERYKNLSCVSLILPWSTPSMRFCTSELKTAIICQRLTELFPNQVIISVTGVRRSESKDRQRTPVQQSQPALLRKKKNTGGITWNPLVDWTLAQVWDAHKVGDLPIHQAYRHYGCSRVSCTFCIMSSQSDLRGALKALHNHAAYRQLIDLENASGFSFQGSTWLASLAPELLSAEQQMGHQQARYRAQERTALQQRLPKRIRFTKGWPTEMIGLDDAKVLAMVRQHIAQLYGWADMPYTTAESIQRRYAELLRQKSLRKTKNPVAVEVGPARRSRNRRQKRHG